MYKILSISIPLICVIVGLYLGLHLGQQKSESIVTTSSHLESDKDYYILLKRVELKNQLFKSGQSKDWDPDESAPDIYYQINWQGKRIHRSATREDSFIATWSPIGINLKTALFNHRISLEQLIEAAIISPHEKSKLFVEIFDADVFGEDTVTRLDLDIEQLKVGDNFYLGKENESYKKITLRIIRKDTPLNQLIKSLTQP